MIHRILKSSALAAAILSVSLVACKKDEAKKEAPAKVAPETEKAATEPPAANPTPEPAPTESATETETKDFFVVEVSHAEPKPEDPVKISFPEVRIVNSSVNLANLETSTAELELSMTKIDSGVPKRDGHLGSPDYFDSAKFGTATIKVTNVKAKDDKTFTATGEVTAHGVTKSWPVEFSVAETTSDSITVEAEHTFSRLDFGVGKAEEDPAATEVVAKLRVTLPVAGS